ncbi:hypothetical protein L596_008290 [Steinernema carpocapsae]|uniref:STAS domain-containing protein n=1 Tax=Steinernema carpocapsae TaxID=34508 RepID=A0A4U5PD39_STECR|nr:hypothetical protein L596_008290 [Steinernema carpocapsae]
MSQDAEDGPAILDGTPSALRNPMNQEEFDAKFAYDRPKKPCELERRSFKALRSYYEPFTSCSLFLSALLSFFPIVDWLPKYKFRENLMYDIIGGFTVGIMHVPQGIAYAILAKVDPVVGLYTSFFPALIYMIFGTSRHNSIGSFAVVSLMTGLAVEQLLETHGVSLGSDAASNQTRFSETLTPVVIASTLTLSIGLVEFLMAFARLDFITTYFSDQVVSGFTTGASCHVLVAQLKDVFAIEHLPKRNESYGMVFWKIYDTIANISQTNWWAFGISMISIVLLIVGKEYINPLVKKHLKSPVPIPFELLLVIIGTVVSGLCDWRDKLDIKVVNKIPAGFPLPSLPQFSLLPSLFVHALGIAVVIVAVHISLAKMFAKKMKYKVDPRQELYALGFTSIFAGLFPVFPSSTSLGRTMVNVEAGTKTLLSTVFSSALLVAMILYLGQWLEMLPMCVLSAIIIVALKGIFKKFADLKTLWPLSKTDFSIWVVSFVATVAWDVMPGLVVSICYALCTTVFRTQWPRWHFLANLNGTNDFRDSERYKKVHFFNGICVFRFDSPLLFTNVERFKSTIYKAMEEWHEVGYDVLQPEDLKIKISAKHLPEVSLVLSHSSTDILGMDQPSVQKSEAPNIMFPSKHFVIDCSGFTFVDYMGVNAIKEIYSEMRQKEVLVYFAAAKAPVRDLFESSGFYKFVPKQNFYPTIRDAVAIARQRQNASTIHLLAELAQALKYDGLDEIITAQPMN